MRKITLRNEKGEDIFFTGKLLQRDELSDDGCRLIFQIYVTDQNQIVLDVDYEAREQAAHMALRFENPKEATAFMDKVREEIRKSGNILKAMMN